MARVGPQRHWRGRQREEILCVVYVAAFVTSRSLVQNSPTVCVCVCVCVCLRVSNCVLSINLNSEKV